jgi:hypothetical protein
MNVDKQNKPTTYTSSMNRPIHSRNNPCYQLWPTFLLLGGLTGCLSVELNPPPAIFYSYSETSSHFSRKTGKLNTKTKPGHTRLYNRIPYRSVLELRFKPLTEDPLRAGTIFAGVVVPVGSITVVTPSLHLESSLRHQLLQESTQVVSTQKMEAPEITIDSLSLTVWDLLITRKVSCDLATSIASTGPHGETTTTGFTVHHSAYTIYAFKKELSFYLNECFDLLARRIKSRIRPKN